MKKLMLFIAVAVFLAVPAVSMAADSFVGSVPSITIQHKSLDEIVDKAGNPVLDQFGNPKTKLGTHTDKVTAVPGVDDNNLTFTVTDNGDGSVTADGYLTFNGNGGKVNNVSLHFIVKLLSPTGGKAPVGQGSLDGSFDVTSDSGTETISISGACDAKLALTFDTNMNVTKGTGTMKVYIESVTVGGLPVPDLGYIILPALKFAPPSII